MKISLYNFKSVILRREWGWGLAAPLEMTAGSVTVTAGLRDQGQGNHCRSLQLRIHSLSLNTGAKAQLLPSFSIFIPPSSIAESVSVQENQTKPNKQNQKNKNTPKSLSLTFPKVWHCSAHEFLPSWQEHPLYMDSSVCYVCLIISS